MSHASSTFDVDDEVPSMRSSVSSLVSSLSSEADGSRPISAPVASKHHPSGHHTYTSRATTAPTTANASAGGNTNCGGDQNVRVVARVRPLSTKELGERSSESIVADAEQVTIRVAHPSEDMPSSGSGGGDKRKFEFDAVFGPSSTQAEVYENSCGDMISSSIYRGYNATILAYGQTGSGKTFTMGTDGSSTGLTSHTSGEDMKPPSSSEGVIARAVYDLFQTKNSLPNGRERVKVTMSYLEIYNEQAIDLLNDDPATANATLQVRDSKVDGVIIPNLKHFPVSSNLDVLALMEKASLKRATGSTHMNLVSSRSHAICTLNVTIAPEDDHLVEEGAEENHDGDISPRSATSLSLNSQGVRAKLTLVDLAGSERIKRTGAEGARMKEGININKGLFVLGQVVSALSELGQRNNGSSALGQHSHIPYRDSKLTRLLQDSLGGNSRTVMIACISPAESNIEESINTLRYAERTRNIKNSAKINAVSAGSSASEAVALRRENQQLKLELARMESKLNSSNTIVADGSTGFSFGGLISSGNIESALQLQAQCSSLLAEIEQLKGRAQGHAEEILEASLRADKWQAKAEAIAQIAQSQGVDLSCLEEVASANDDLVSQLRSQLAECKAEVLDARTEAMVARATAGAILAARGDLSNIEHIEISDDSLNLSASEDSLNEELTAELTAVSATIQQKEAMVIRMNKERACLDSINPHYENLLKHLMTEVDALTAERNDLMLKMSANENENSTKRQRKGDEPHMTKRLREQIGKLECRIDELKVKANEHERSMKMKEEADKKCARLLAEIAEDKRRRADLQRKLKEASVEMRTEKKAAQQTASKLLKDSQRLKIELTKMKNVAQKQAAVLKRKIDQASAKEKARVELDRKRRSAENMRLASSSNSNPQVNETRKTELSSWIDHEFEYSLIKFEIDDQRRRLENAVADRGKLMASSGDVVCVEELEEMDIAIRSLRITVQDLETTAKKAFPTAGDCNGISTFRFLDTEKFKGLSKHDATYTMTYIFDKCLLVKQEMATILSNQEATTKTTIAFELAKERHLHEKEKTNIKMEHALATLNLLQSTQDTVNSHIKLNIDNDGVGIELKEQLKGILGAYHANWSSATDALKMHLSEIKETHSEHEAMIDNLTKGMAVASIKFTTKKKKAAQHNYDSEAFESEESFVDDGEGEDSEYEPTPAKSKQKRRSPRLASKKVIASESPASPIGENFVDDIESMKVGTLKKACKKLGVPVTGKKADLMQRVRNHILNTSVLNASVLNSSVASHNLTEERKKVIFECGDEVDPEFRPVDDKHDTTESIKKQLWCETDVHASDETSHSSTKSSMPSKKNMCDGKENNGSMTPGKRVRLLGFGSPSPRVLSPRNIQSTPAHLKQTIATSKKRLVPDAKQSLDVTKRSANKRAKRGMNDAVARALEQCGDLL